MSSEYLTEHFETTTDGVVAYKVFGLHYPARADWQIVPGNVIAEVVNPSRTNDCGCGVNVATLDWVRQNAPRDAVVWKCLIRWTWLADVVVPYNTDGKIRAGKVELVEIVK